MRSGSWAGTRLRDQRRCVGLWLEKDLSYLLSLRPLTARWWQDTEPCYSWYNQQRTGVQGLLVSPASLWVSSRSHFVISKKKTVAEYFVVMWKYRNNHFIANVLQNKKISRKSFQRISFAYVFIMIVVIFDDLYFTRWHSDTVKVWLYT